MQDLMKCHNGSYWFGKNRFSSLDGFKMYTPSVFYYTLFAIVVQFQPDGFHQG